MLGHHTRNDAHDCKFYRPCVAVCLFHDAKR